MNSRACLITSTRNCSGGLSALRVEAIERFIVRVVRHCNKSPREAADAPSPEAPKASLNEALSNPMESVSTDGRGLQWDGL